jgi:DNA-binding beta-propeller fold protein YncE
MPKFRCLALIGAAALAMTMLAAKPGTTALPLYILSKTIPLGGDVKWDYLHFDPSSDEVFVSHGTELTVLNAKTGTIAGHIQGLQGSHGIAIDDATGRGYADSAETKTAVVFDLRTLKIIKTIPALLDADGMAFDPASKQVFIAGGDAKAVLAVDTKTNEPVKSISLGGSPEFLVADGLGSLYLNIKDKNEIVRVDTKTNAVIARWPVAPCDRPTGLAIDRASRRLFSSCRNALMVVVDADSGKVVASLPIGKGTDAAAFDSRRKFVFSSNRDGTLSVIQENSPDNFTVLQSVKTEPGARTMAVDPVTGQIFLVTAQLKSAGAPQYAGGPPFYEFVPGTVKALYFVPRPRL